MRDRIIAQRQKRAELITAARTILDASTADTLSAEDQTRYDGLMKESDDLKASYERMERQLATEDELATSRSAPTLPIPGTPPEAPEKGKRSKSTKEYRRAFGQYLRSGAVSPELRALQMDNDPAGGFIVAPQEFSDAIIKFVDDAVFIRQFATKLRVEKAESLGVPTLATDPADADWTTELAVGSEDTTMTFGKREFRPNPLAKLLRVSNKLIRATGGLRELDDDGSGAGPTPGVPGPATSIDDYVVTRLAYKFAIASEKAFMTGSGNLRPLGVFTASSDGIDTSRDITAASATAVVADDLINTKYGLKAQYRNKPGTAWLLSRTLVQNARKLKDTNGQYLWTPGAIGQASLTVGQPDRILDLPFYESEYVPNTFTTGLYVALLGDFSFYWVVDALDFTIQRLVELYAATNQTGFIGRLETDGMPVLAEAFSRLKLA